jgi:hypothetical protein
MKQLNWLSSKKVFLGLVCVLFFLGSADPGICARKGKKRKKKAPRTSVTETVTTTTESPAPAAESVTETFTTTAESPSAAAEGDVYVYAEGAYTTDDLTVYIYADINVVLCSYGVALNYATSKLISDDEDPNGPVAVVNEEVWYMGTEGATIPYMPPETSTAGKVVFIGAKLDTDTPTAGVTGDRVLLGKVTFSRTEGTDPGATPETYFGITLALGRPDLNPPTVTFDNFVCTDGTIEDDDGVSFTALTVRERGDANADGVITNMDMFAVKDMLSASYVPYADCNDDKVITNMDMFCIKDKL